MKKYILLISIFISCISTYAQDSLRYYLEVATKNNPAVLQKYTDYQLALQKVPQVGTLPDPQVTIGVFLSPMELISGKQVASIQLMQMFPWFGVLQHAQDEMSLMAKAKYEFFRDAKLELQFEVQRTYNELNKINKTIKIAEINNEILHSIERLSLIKYQSSINLTSSNTATNNNRSSTENASLSTAGSGMGGNVSMPSNQAPKAMKNSGMGSVSTNSGLVDIYRIQLEIGELENSIDQFKNQFNSLQIRFNAQLNRPINLPIFMLDSLIVDTLPISATAISDSMLVNSPMLSMLQYEQQSIESRKKMVQRMGYPMVGLGINYSLINKNAMSTSPMNGNDMIMPMLTISLPIYRKKYKAMQTEANLMKLASEQNAQATVNSLQSEYSEAMQLYLDAERRIKLYERQRVLSEKSLTILLSGFSTSGTALNELLRIRQQTLDYETKHIEAISDYNISIAWLKRLACFN